MSEAPGDAAVRSAKLAKELAEGTGQSTAHREGFGTGSLFVGRKMFAVLDESCGLILKLPAERVAQLITEGHGSGWHPGTGKPLKEYISIPVSEQRRWLALAKESREFMRSQQ
jgi:hypothetical protein